MTQEYDSALWTRATALLARREYARGELASKLTRRGEDAAAVERVLDTLEARGLLSDQRFTEQYSRSRINRGYGPRRIRQELREHGIADTATAEVVDETPEFWSQQASEAREKRFGPVPPVDQRAWARQARFLERRGFTSEQIREALGRPPLR